MRKIASIIVGIVFLAASAVASAYPSCSGKSATSCGQFTTQSACVGAYLAPSTTPCLSCSTTSPTGCAQACPAGNRSCPTCTKPGIQCTWNGSSCTDGGAACTN